MVVAALALGVLVPASSPAADVLCPAALAPTTTTSTSTTTTTAAPATTTTAPVATTTTAVGATTTTTRATTTTTTRATTTTVARSTTTSTTAPQPIPAVRLAGVDRYGTAAAVSRATFAPLVPVVFIATGLGFADALAAGPMAAQVNAPILLVTRDAIPAVTAAELDRLRPRQIVVLGGTQVVSDAVVAQLDIFSTGPVTRLAGVDRYATAAAISAVTFQPGVPVALVATGDAFPDALAAGPVAGCAAGPLLLVTETSVPAATAAELQRLRPARVIVLGAPSVVSAKLEAVLAALTGGTVDRASGADRYDTAAALSSLAYPAGVATVYVATGEAFPDALSAGAVAGRVKAPILLVPPTGVPPSVAVELARLNPRALVVLGGSKMIPETIVTTLCAL